MDPSRYEVPLAAVAQAMGDPNGQVDIGTWQKKPTSGLQQGRYKDPQGRTWEATPESVNTGMNDGVEWISPPLKTPEDDRTLLASIRSIENTGLYVPGIRSSMHVTVGVETVAPELVRAPAAARDAVNISGLVDTILYTETHWPEIYSAVSPVRYGTIVNRFAVPMVASIPKLFEELEALPPAERTYGRVRAMFQSYSAELSKLKGDDAWKKSAANYLKLFQLDGASFAPVMEYRIPDMVDAERVQPITRFLRTMVAEGPRLKASEPFRNPFDGIVPGREDFSSLNQRIYRSSASAYRNFLTKVGFPAADYPKLGALGGPLSLAVPGPVATQAMQEVGLTHAPTQDIPVGGAQVKVERLGNDAHARLRMTIPPELVPGGDVANLEAWLGRAALAVNAPVPAAQSS